MITPLLPTYRRMPITFERGEGMYLYDSAGKKYLDLYSGIGVNALGHAHPHLVEALKDQGEKLWHLSNLYEIPGQQRLAERLVAASFADTVFFTNSGAEAIELCIKMVRKHFSDKGQSRHRMVTMGSAFHGRTLAGIAAAGQEKLVAGFGPLPEGFDVVGWGDLDAVEAAITPSTGAIMVEPVQGEGGIRPLGHNVMKGLRDLADKYDLLLVFDEIQCGMGRTGKLFNHEWADVKPDIVASAKGIGGGFPIGAVLATENAASGMVAGTHGTTYGGNPLAMAIGNAVMDVMLADGFMEHVVKVGNLLQDVFVKLKNDHPTIIDEVRGTGLMLGMKCPSVDTRVAVLDLVKRGLLVAPAGDSVIRFLPPLIMQEAHVEEAYSGLDAAFTDWETNGVPSE